MKTIFTVLLIILPALASAKVVCSVHKGPANQYMSESAIDDKTIEEKLNTLCDTNKPFSVVLRDEPNAQPVATATICCNSK